MNRLRVLIGDDHVLLLNGTKALLETEYDVVGTVTDGRQLVDAALRLRPDVVVLDVSMPHLNGLEAAKRIHAELPSAKLVFLSMHTNPVYLRKAVESGARAYVLKTGAAEELSIAIRHALNGDLYFSPGFGSDVIENIWTRNGEPSRQADDLTGRQREILQLIAEGLQGKEVAAILNISVKTVDFHRARIMARLGARSIAEMVRIGVEQGIIPAATVEI